MDYKSFDLYISKDIYYQENRPEEVNKFYSDSRKIYIEISKSDLGSELSKTEQSQSPRKELPNPTSIITAPNLISRIRNRKEVFGLSRAIILLDKITDDEAIEIEKFYGVICRSVTIDNVDDKIIELLKYFDYQNILFSKDVSKNVSKDVSKDVSEAWDKVFNTYPFPANSIIIMDRYFIKDDNPNFYNLEQIITKYFSKGPSYIDIVFIVEYEQDVNSDLFDKICGFISQIKGIKSGRISLLKIVDTHNCHNRKIISNYSILSAEHMIAAFGHKTNPVQRIDICTNIMDNFAASETIFYIDSIYNLRKDGKSTFVQKRFYREDKGKITYEDLSKYELALSPLLLLSFCIEELEIRKKIVQFYYFIGQKSNDIQDRISAYTVAIDNMVNPNNQVFKDNVCVYKYRGQARFENNDFEGAMDDFNVYLKNNVNDYEVLLQMGRVQYRLAMKEKDDERVLYLLKKARSSFTKYEENTHSSLQGDEDYKDVLLQMEHAQHT